MRVAPNGGLFIVGLNSSLSSYVVSRSTDAQDPNDASTSFTTSSVNLGGSVVYFSGPNPDGLLGQSWIEIDPSAGPNGGNIYIVSSVDPSGSDPLDVHFVRSTNNGATWSTPLRLNDDSGNNWNWFGTMSVAPNGRIDVVWNDTRNTGQQNLSELFYTYSTDGGVTWSPNQQLSSVWDSWVGWPNQNKIGDYYHMRSDLVGADLAWAATFNGEQDVYYTRIGDHDCNQNGISDEQEIAQGAADTNGNGILDECEGIIVDVADSELGSEALGGGPNPFHESTNIRFQMPESGRVQVRVFTTSGQLARTVFDGSLSGGTHERVWDGTNDQGERLPAGLYFVDVNAAGHRSTRRMVLLQ
ncbi:MAG: FlgD immunoglobulin-like domain containing protein [Candidatus Eisenbacteria bacterium]